MHYGLMWHVPVPLDVEAMHEAAQLLLGVHDYSTFRSSECQAQSPIRSIDKCDVIKLGDEIQIIVRHLFYMMTRLKQEQEVKRVLRRPPENHNHLQNLLVYPYPFFPVHCDLQG